MTGSTFTVRTVFRANIYLEGSISVLDALMCTSCAISYKVLKMSFYVKVLHLLKSKDADCTLEHQICVDLLQIHKRLFTLSNREICFMFFVN